MMNRVAATLREKGGDDLRQELVDLRRELFNLRMQRAVQQNTKGSELRRVRRGIARIITILGEKERDGQIGETAPAPAPVAQSAAPTPSNEPQDADNKEAKND